MKKIIVIFGLLATMVSCFCSEPECESITDQDRALIPYELGDSLRFKSVLTDSVVIYVVTAIDEASPKVHYNRDQGACPICVPVHIKRLKLLTEFWSFAYEKNFPIEVEAKVIKYNGEGLILYEKGRGSYYNFPSHAFSLDSLNSTDEVINGQVFKDVYRTFPDDYGGFGSFAFTKEEGLLSFTHYETKETWEIIIK